MQMTWPRNVKYDEKTNTFSYDHIVVNKYHNDKYMLTNVFKGSIISPDIYPLIYDLETEHCKYRSLCFYEKVLKNIDLYSNMTSDNKIIFHIGLRDSFMASEMNLLAEEEKQLFKNIINATHGNDLIDIAINGLDIKPYPTSTNIMLKYIDIMELGNKEYEQYFLIKNGFMIVFVDPSELSYHNFENILDLDHRFTDLTPGNVSFIEKIKDKDIYTCYMGGWHDLLYIDDLDLYSIPLNCESRGGKRLIFKSKQLAEYLSITLKDLFDRYKENFEMYSHINNVFRYNKFKPSDGKFTSHYDTPYVDYANNEVSKYTLIIYLTEGNAENYFLKVDDYIFEKVEGEFYVVIFNQKYEHEGNPFIDNDKIFLRTELIFNKPYMNYNEKIAQAFNMSCYMIKQSMYNPEIKKYINDSFNHTNKLRYRLNSETKILYYHKSINNISFVTNGHNYWFCL